MRLLLGLALLASGCTHLVWYGSSPDRRHIAAVREVAGVQSVRHDLRDGPGFKGVGVDALKLTNEHLAYPAQRDDGKWVVVLDGVPSEAFDGVGELAVGHRAALFAAERNGRWVVHAPLGPSVPATWAEWDEVLPGSLQVDATEPRWAFAGRRGGQVWWVGWSVQRGPFEAVGQTTWSPAGEAWFVARTVEGTFVHDLGQTRHGPYEDVVGLTVSEAGRIAFAFKRGKEWRVFDGTAESAEGFTSVVGISFRGGHLFFAGERNVRDWLGFDGTLRGPFLSLKRTVEVFDDMPYFAAREATGWYVHRRMQPLGPWNDVRSLVVDGVHDGFIGEFGEQDVIVIDGAVVERWYEAHGLTLANGHSLYLGLAQGQHFVVYDGQRYPFELVLPDTLVLSADGLHFACIAGLRDKRELYFVVDGRRTGRVDLEELAAEQTRRPVATLTAGTDRIVLREWVVAELARVIAQKKETADGRP